jgi:hypothetical protein
MKRLLMIGCAAIVIAAACTLSAEDEQGKECKTAKDCRQPYSCVETNPNLFTCELLALPNTGAVQDVLNEDAGQPYYCAEVSQVLNTYCVSTCHGVDRTGSGLQPFRLDYYDPPDAGDLPGAHQKAANIKIRTYDQRTMPPAGSPLPSDAQRLLIRNWVAAGAPECNTPPDAGP